MTDQKPTNVEAHALREQLTDLEKMRCPVCSAIAPENEKDWPKTECVVCAYFDQLEVLRSRAEAAEKALAEAQAREAKLEVALRDVPSRDSARLNGWNERAEALLATKETKR